MLIHNMCNHLGDELPTFMRWFDLMRVQLGVVNVEGSRQVNDWKTIFLCQRKDDFVVETFQDFI